MNKHFKNCSRCYLKPYKIYSGKTAFYYAVRNKDLKLISVIECSEYYLFSYFYLICALPWASYAGPYTKLDFDSAILS